MITAAIISEYNPFHTGHEYQINEIRKEFGNDTRIIAIMSGNYTQRGDIAIADKSIRAECAVKAGVNLVLEIPFPFSLSSAELFAASGVKIADEIGVVDFLSFGSESGSISSITEIAENMLGEDFKLEQKRLLADEALKDMGYPKICEIAYQNLFGTYEDDIFAPNNILAIEYVKALMLSNSRIKPHTIKRNGSGYKCEKISDDMHQSASAIRHLIFKNDTSALEYIPNSSIKTISKAIEEGKIPCDPEKLSSAVIHHFLLNPTAQKSIHDTAGGLYNRLQKASREATSISSLIELAGTKKFTTARIKRAIWYSFFGVTSSEVKKLPEYTQVLAMDEVGMAILKSIKKVSEFPVLTKPSVFTSCSDTARKQKELSDRADAMFQLTKPTPAPIGTALSTTPFIMK